MLGPRDFPCLHACWDQPFEVINQAVKAVEQHLQTFRHREKKKLPSFLDWFGWCTWDAFYKDFTAEYVEQGQGLQTLSDGGAPAKFLIINDGWQHIESLNDVSNDDGHDGAEFAIRLTGIKETEKFQKNGKNDNHVPGLKLVVDDAKKRHNVKCILKVHGGSGYYVKLACSDV